MINPELIMFTLSLEMLVYKCPGKTELRGV